MIRSAGGAPIPTPILSRLRARALVGLALGLAMAAPAIAQEEPPRFMLERIAVEGLRRAGADRLVVAESLLREGSSYSEDDLRLAVYRIKRLPFILDADFTLRKGSERGRYELLIGVEEVKPYFLQYFADYELSERPGGLASFRDRLSDSGIVGARYFVNSHDLAFAAWNPDGFVNLGYTRFNLFGRGGYASLQASVHSGGSDRNLSLTAAVPIAGNHAVRSTTSWFESDFSSSWGQGLEWLYTTTDDPLLPSEGVESSVSANYNSGRLKRILRDDGTVGPLGERGVGMSAGGRRHWPLTLRQSVSLGANAFYGRHRADRENLGVPAGVEQKTYGSAVNVGYAVGLLRTRGVGPRRDLRFETGLFYSDQRFDSSFFLDRSRSWGANLGLVFRNAWSLIRLSFRYSRQIGDGR